MALGVVSSDSTPVFTDTEFNLTSFDETKFILFKTDISDNWCRCRIFGKSGIFQGSRYHF